MFMASYLYRKAVRRAIPLLITALVVSFGFAQTRRKEKGPRALAIIELPKDPKAAPRLIPITILDNGRFFDASVYRAAPQPMAVEPGVVYEAQSTGKPVGFFTVEGARQVNGEWVALGHWKAQSEAEKTAAKSVAPPIVRDDDRPPVLRRPPAPESTPAPAPKPDEPASSVPPPEQQADPDRPTLRRGRPAQQEHEEAEFQLPTKNTPAAQPAQPAGAFRQVLVGVSDAGGPNPRPYEFHWSAEEQQQLTRRVSEIASAELVSYAHSKPGLKYPPAATLDQAELKSFDLFYDNNPEMVFTGRVPRAGATPTRGGQKFSPADYFYYVTVVVRQEPDGELRKLFSSVTDTAHLDAFPRLELLDAVDAEGSGRGALLFRTVSGSGRTYRVYRVTRDALWKLFEGGSGAQ
jgi:hypothetical protein